MHRTVAIGGIRRTTVPGVLGEDDDVARFAFDDSDESVFLDRSSKVPEFKVQSSSGAQVEQKASVDSTPNLLQLLGVVAVPIETRFTKSGLHDEDLRQMRASEASCLLRGRRERS